MDFWGVCGGRDEGRCFFCFWYLTFVSLLFFFGFLGVGESRVVGLVRRTAFYPTRDKVRLPFEFS